MAKPYYLISADIAEVQVLSILSNEVQVEYDRLVAEANTKFHKGCTTVIRSHMVHHMQNLLDRFYHSDTIAGYVITCDDDTNPGDELHGLNMLIHIPPGGQRGDGVVEHLFRGRRSNPEAAKALDNAVAYASTIPAPEPVSDADLYMEGF